MIDYLRCRVVLPRPLPAPVKGGETVKLDAAGIELFRTMHRLPMPGSFESSLNVRSVSPFELEIEGNPVKWLQGHNLYGCDDVPTLLMATLSRLLPLLGTTPADCGILSPWSIADTIITRVDVTQMLVLDTPGDVRSWIRSAELNGRAGRRGRGVMKSDTLVFGDATGRNFARWQIVIYAKGQEVRAHPLPRFMMDDPAVIDWVNRSLRVEVRLGRLELDRQELRTLGGWLPNFQSTRDAMVDQRDLWRDKVSQLEFNTGADAHFDLEKLPLRLRATFVSWRAGADVRTLLSKPTFYRYRKHLMELTGVDVSIPPPSVPTADVVPIKRTLEARPAGRPDWADRIDARLLAGGATIVSVAA